MNRERNLRELRGRDYSAAPRVESYPEPSKAEQERALAELQRKSNNRRRIKHV